MPSNPIPPLQDKDLLDGSDIVGASKGKIEGSGVGGSGVGTVLQDLREAYLEDFGGLGLQRDRCATQFDTSLDQMAARALSPEQDDREVAILGNFCVPRKG